jgi:hypothetical protein
MATALQSIKIFGPPEGAAGVSVIEQTSTSILDDPRYGAIALFGVLKRGPSGLPVAVSSKQQYLELFGDPKNPAWHLYDNSAHLCPDAIDGFFTTGTGQGILFLTRLELDNARPAELTIKNRQGAEVLKFSAANPGRWGGYKSKIPLSTVIVATSRTFTIVAPNVKSNEYIGATVNFTSGSGKSYQIIANTGASEVGETVFTIGAQYDLVADGVSGPISIDGTATYSRTKALTGTIVFPLLINLPGICSANDLTVTGIGSQFQTLLKVGGNIYLNGEARRIESITSETTLTIAEAFSVNGTNLVMQRDNLVITGNGTQFLSELTVGDSIYFSTGTEEHNREIAAITSNTEIVLASGFDFPIASGSPVYANNSWVLGTNSDYGTDLNIGDAIIDPNRRGEAVTVAEIDPILQQFKVSPLFSDNFTDAQLTKQSQKCVINLNQPANTGLAVEIGQGTKYPATHFSVKVWFNGSQMLFLPDASLDKEDPLFIETVLNNGNIGYRTSGQDFQTWIKVESYWNSAYTTSESSDVRPCNGAGTVLGLTPQRLYTVADFDYSATIGRQFFPNPYKYPRNGLRIKGASPPVAIEGTISSSGVNVYGTGTVFKSVLKRGDFLYEPESQVIRKIRLILSDTELILETMFPANIVAGTKTIKAGYLLVDQGTDLNQVCKLGDRFIVSYPEYLTKGYDGDTAHLIPYNFTRYFDIDRNYLETAVWGRNVGLVRMAVPGISDTSTQRAGVEYAYQKAFEMRVEIPSYINNAAVAEAFINQDLERNDSMSVAFPSYGYVSNPNGTGDRFISISGDIMGLESAKASLVQGYHYPAAGTSARLSRVIKLPFSPSPNDEAILNLAGIQPIKVFSGRTIIFGARCPAVNDIYSFLHVRRIQSNYVRIFLEAESFLQSLFQPNQPELAQQIVLILENFARREYSKGVYTKYLSFGQAILVTSSADQAAGNTDVLVSILNGKLNVYYSYIPTGILERLQIFVSPDTLLSRSGAGSVSGSSGI